MKKSSARLLGILMLLFSLVLSGCSGGTDPEGGEPGTDSPPPPAASGSPAADAAMDIEKYNAYLSLANGISDMDGILMTYFSVVKDQPEFELADGMDYSMLNDTFRYYYSRDALLGEALEASSKEPAYPEQDALLADLQAPYEAMNKALTALSQYFYIAPFADEVYPYETDSMAQAQELHTQLYNAVDPFYEAATPFVESMSSLAEAGEQDELDRLQAEGMHIAYYSRIALTNCVAISSDILEQVGDGESLPALDMTNLEALYTSYQEAYAGLTEALADSAEIEKVPGWISPDYDAADYGQAAADLDAALTELMDAARAQGDYSQSYLTFADAVSYMVDLYNRDFT